MYFKNMILVMAAMILAGCDQSSSKYINELKNYKQPPDTDVTLSPQYNFSSFSGTVWQTKVKMALADYKEYTGVYHIYLFVPDRFDSTQSDYRPLPGMGITAVLPPGTRLRVGQLIKDNGIGDQLWVTGTLVDTTNSEKTIYLDQLMLANNRFVSLGPTSSTNWGVNPDMLEAVTNAP
jgi:hypothetical protein